MSPKPTVVAFLAVMTAAVIQPGTASADSRSWAVARENLPAEVQTAVGANLASLRDTAIYQQMMPGLLAMLPDAQAALAAARSVCGIDILGSIRDVTFAVTPADEGLLVASLRKIGPGDVHACAQKLADRNGRKGPITRAVRDGITEYGRNGHPERLFVAWLASDVVAVATEPADRAVLLRMIGGKGPTGDMAAATGRVNTDAELWMAAVERRPVGDGPTAATMRMGYGAVDFTGDDIVIDGSLALSTADEARRMTRVLGQQLAESLADMPPELARIARNTRFTADGDTAQVRITMTGHDLMVLLGATLHEMGRDRRTAPR